MVVECGKHWTMSLLRLANHWNYLLLDQVCFFKSKSNVIILIDFYFIYLDLEKELPLGQTLASTLPLPPVRSSVARINAPEFQGLQPAPSYDVTSFFSNFFTKINYFCFVRFPMCRDQNQKRKAIYVQLVTTFPNQHYTIQQVLFCHS